MLTWRKTKRIGRSFLPALTDIKALQAAAPCLSRMRACIEHATQVVFGEGPEDANVVMVGEQPGDEEDHKGHPFVGPAGDSSTRQCTRPNLTGKKST